MNLAKNCIAVSAALSICACVNAAGKSSIPTLDEMAGDWLKAENVLNPPSINSRKDMLQVRYDLVSSRFNPGGGMLPQTATGVPLPVLAFDGHECAADEMRWSAYEARRRNLNCDSLQIETSVRIAGDEPGFLTQISLHNASTTAQTPRIELRIPGAVAAQASLAVNRTLRRGLVSAFAPCRKPDRIVESGDAVTFTWSLSLPPGASSELDYAVAADSSGEDASVAKADRWSANFADEFAAAKRHWEQRWSEAFTPGNPHFSGHLPILETNDEALRRIYYMSVLTVLACERSQFKVSPRDFLTEPDRPGNQYYWDASMMATVWALLEPQGMKASLRHWLVGDLLNSHGFNISSLKDMSPGEYAFSPANVFYTTLTYIRVTGNAPFLHDTLSNGETVLARLDQISVMWKQRVSPGRTLAGWNRSGNLLESGDPNYLGAVASLNAQAVAMMRDMAALQHLAQNTRRATELRSEAARLLPAVLALYKPGDGVWNSILDNGTVAEQRHVVDFIYVTQAIPADLTPATRDEMLGFVNGELLMKNWLRALSLKSGNARKSGRPDHGPMGAYDGWIPLTVDAMARLGDWSGAVAFLRRTAVSTREGPYAQAHEFCGPGRTSYDAPICVATGPTIAPFESWTPSRGQTSGGYSSKECIAGGAFADVIIGTLFGFQPDLQGLKLLHPKAPRPFEGKLRNLPYRGKLYDITAGRQGVKIAANKPMRVKPPER